MGAKLGRALSVEGRDKGPTNERDSMQTSVDDAANKRSVSRGREGVRGDADASGLDVPRGREIHPGDKISTGRGGAGNYVRSPSRDVEPESRGHVNSANIAAKALSSGRGGAGNIRSSSTSRDRVGPEYSQTASIISDHASKEAEHEREVLQKYLDARKDLVVSGRGGLGNISTSKSRSRSRSKGPDFHSSGRGGAGNIQHGAGDPEHIDIRDDEERLKHTHPQGVHSTGRGGLANLTNAHGPGIEVVHHHDAPFESSGRGGAGNIRDRSTSREPGGRSTSREKISEIWNKVTHTHPHVPTHDPDAIQEVPDKEGGE